ncbi:MAG TPA: hypothetical protein VLV18_10070, partial [Terriglobales bacterium]|nr:hypothetical protein [Terriglobales bacterium]
MLPPRSHEFVPVALLLMLLVSITNMSILLPLAYAAEQPTSILTINHPSIVQVASNFAVTIQVQYSAKFGMVDVGVWDISNGTVLRSLVSNATLQGPGNSTYTLTLTAPSTPREWHLAAIARAWLQNAWFYDNEGEYDFTINVIGRAYLTLTGLQPNSTTNIDSVPYLSNQSTLELLFQLGTFHEIRVQAMIELSPGTRMIFSGWNDGDNSNPRELLVAGNISLSPKYIVQHSLVVNSPIQSVFGNGWYPYGEVAQFGVVSTTQQSSSYFGLVTDSYAFSGWTGDSNSTNASATVFMNGPKIVTAQWVYESATLSYLGIATIFLAASLILALRAAVLFRQRRGTNRTWKQLGRTTCLLLLLVVAIIVSASPPKVFAALPTPAGASIVNVGDASWYYWPQPERNTCILWLGGGLENPQGGYLINPFEYESFGTIRFLQDLTRYYCVVALQRGSSPLDGYPNRTINQEYFQGEFTIAKQLHKWIRSQGYAHIFLLGYSVGTEAAASIALSDPQTWGGSDGIILITANLPPDVANGGASLRTNLLLLYGHAPNFEPSGQEFYSRAPTQDMNGTALYKEYRLLDSMGHEVWSPLRDNSYNPTALGIVVDFIEKSKILQQSNVTISSQLAADNYSVVGV